MRETLARFSAKDEEKRTWIALRTFCRIASVSVGVEAGVLGTIEGDLGTTGASCDVPESIGELPPLHPAPPSALLAARSLDSGLAN